ncbi:hypothetical protein CEXT_472081 [Caerostris extrusa]|uniref:Uncharacterized protein n=1 Tax=Caerostris extrusa TaxID=172846 RepID=A0AAV4W2D6_CAEEX|nr:hypothetical protein CEXT_472081 [Caerostris extrusa]
MPMASMPFIHPIPKRDTVDLYTTSQNFRADCRFVLGGGWTIIRMGSGDFCWRLFQVSSCTRLMWGRGFGQL